MATMSMLHRSALGLVELGGARCFSCTPMTAKKKRMVEVTEQAMQLREERKKKREAASKTKVDPDLCVGQYKVKQRKFEERLKQYEIDKVNRPTYTYSEEFIKSYVRSSLGASKSKLRKADLELTRKKKADLDMEKAHRKHYLDIPINIVHSNFMFEVDGQTHVARSAVHHNIHKDVFMREGLLLTMPLGVKYPDSGFVHCGNLMQPNAVQDPPSVRFPAATPETLYTLVMTTPDGNIYSPRQEVLHWLTCNIKGHDLDSGDVVCPYMPPIPCEGTGYHRYAFALLRQNSRIEGLETLPARDLKARTWSTGRFMSQHDLSIRGLAFFQAQWDLSVSDVFCELGCGEPTYKIETGPTIRLTPEQSEGVRKKLAFIGRTPFRSAI